MTKEQDLFAHLIDEEEKRIGQSVYEVAKQALQTDKPHHTPFVSARHMRVMESVLSSIQGVRWRRYGGYKEAERQRIVVYPDYYLEQLIDVPVSAIEVRGEFPSSISEEWIKRALYRQNIKEDSLGDIVLMPEGFQAIVSAEKKRFITETLTHIHDVSVTCELIDFERLAVPAEREKEIRTTVASLRLDAIAAAGFGTSRTKMARYIKAERVKVNWQTVKNPANEEKEGDIVSMQVRGRVHVTALQGKTRKERTSVELLRVMLM